MRAAKVNNVTLVMPPRKVDTSLKFATSDSSHLVLRWEMFRPRYGNTVEIITGARQAALQREGPAICAYKPWVPTGFGSCLWLSS